MLQSLYSAVAGMRAQQSCIDAIGNNVANISTVGFKSTRADFADTLYSLMQPQQGAVGPLQRGAGAIVGGMQRIMDPGAYLSTGGPLDFMLDGPGYFTLSGPGGTFYTRDGSFNVSMVNGAGYLVTSEGYFVLGTDNRPIQVPGGSTEIAADSLGNLYAGGACFASLRISAFANPAGLADAGGNRAAASAASGPAAAAAGGIVRQGWLEGSNVDLAGEMARLIRAQKAYAVLGAAVRTADEMESNANRLSG